jgi:hypothetical protein
MSEIVTLTVDGKEREYRVLVVNGAPQLIGYGVNLSNADLSGADLQGLDLSFVNLQMANLSFANLSGCNLVLRRLDRCAGDRRRPARFDPARSGHARCEPDLRRSARRDLRQADGSRCLHQRRADAGVLAHAGRSCVGRTGG